MAMSLLPIQGSSTLVHGSCDVSVIHTDDPKCEALLDSIMCNLNLKKHRVGLSGTKISTPIDLEVHRGTDGKYYCLDFARLFPPTPPTGHRGAHLYQLLRPEFVQKCPSAISSDAFSMFTTPSDRESDSQEAKRASDHLVQNVVPKYSEYFDHCVDLVIRSNDAAQTLVATDAIVGQLEPFLSLEDADSLLRNLAESLHRTGINIRMLGFVRRHCKLAISKSLLLAEMVARCARKEVKHMLRAASKSSSMPTFTVLNRAATGFLNRLFSTSNNCNCPERSPACHSKTCTSDSFWKYQLVNRLSIQFPFSLSDTELQDGGLSLRNVNFGQGTYLRVVFRRLCALGAFQLREATVQELSSSAAAFERESVFATADVVGFQSITKMPPVATIAEGMVMLHLATEASDALERKRMLRLAVESFEEAVAICPASPECLTRLSDGLYQLALPASREEAMQLLKSSLDRAETSLQVVAQRVITSTKDPILSDPFAAAIHEDSPIMDSRAAHTPSIKPTPKRESNPILRLASRKLIHTHESYGGYYVAMQQEPAIEEALEDAAVIKPAESPEISYYSLTDLHHYDNLRAEDFHALTDSSTQVPLEDAFEAVTSGTSRSSQLSMLTHARSYRSFRKGPTALTEHVTQNMSNGLAGGARPWYRTNEFEFDLEAFQESSTPPQTRAWSALAITLIARVLMFAMEKAPAEPRRAGKTKIVNDFQLHLAAIVGLDRALVIENDLRASKICLQLSLNACCVVGLLPTQVLHNAAVDDDEYDTAVCRALDDALQDPHRVRNRIRAAMTCFSGANSWHDVASLVLCASTALYIRGSRQFGTHRVAYLGKAKALLTEFSNLLSSLATTAADTRSGQLPPSQGVVTTNQLQTQKLLEKIDRTSSLLRVPDVITLKATKLHAQEATGVCLLKLQADGLHLFAVSSAFDGFLRLQRVPYQFMHAGGSIESEESKSAHNSSVMPNETDTSAPTFGNRFMRAFSRSGRMSRSSATENTAPSPISGGYQLRKVVDGELSSHKVEWDSPLQQLGNDECLEVMVHEDRIFCMAIRPLSTEPRSPDIFCVSDPESSSVIAFTGSNDKTIRAVDLLTGHILKRMMAQEAVECIASSPTLVASGHSQGVILLWSALDANLGAALLALRGHTHAIRCVAIQGSYIVSGGVDRTIRVWSAEHGTALRVLSGTTNNKLDAIFDMHGTMDEFLLATADRRTRLWNMHIGEETLQLRNSNQEIALSVALIPEIRCVVTGHADGFVTIWDIQTGAMVYTTRPFGVAVNHISCAVLPQPESHVITTVVLLCTSKDGHVKHLAFQYDQELA